MNRVIRPHPVRLIRRSEVLDARGVGCRKLYEDIAAGLWTPPIKLGRRTATWPHHETQALICAAIEGKSPAEIRELVLELCKQRKSATVQFGVAVGSPQGTNSTQQQTEGNARQRKRPSGLTPGRA
jgi:predicted DNA-binding transcriptional regulator AlpA